MTEVENQIDNIKTSFYVFIHNPYKRGGEGNEDGSKILDHLLYFYPSTIPDRQLEHLLGVLISLYTFTSLSLEGKSLDFISWSNSKLAIRTISLDSDTKLFFVLRAPSIYSDTSVSCALDHIKLGLSFVLGEKGLLSKEILIDYLKNNGERVLKKVLPPDNPNPLIFSFTNLPNAEWNRASVASTLTELIVMRLDKRIWGCVFFIDNLLLISHSPLDIIQLFSFIPENEFKIPVFLTLKDREGLIGYKGCIAEIPELSNINTLLLKFKYDRVTFFVLTSPNIDENLINQIDKTVRISLPQISTSPLETTKQQCPHNSLVYDGELNMLKVGTSSIEFQKNAILAHDLFVRNDKLKDIIMGNIKEFTLCMNILSVEYHSSVQGNSKSNFEELYDDTLKLNPELFRFLQGLRNPQ